MTLDGESGPERQCLAYRPYMTFSSFDKHAFGNRDTESTAGERDTRVGHVIWMASRRCVYALCGGWERGPVVPEGMARVGFDRGHTPRAFAFGLVVECDRRRHITHKSAALQPHSLLDTPISPSPFTTRRLACSVRTEIAQALAIQAD
ncbi:hypothetical protein ACGC1H_006476 [Rhizoctonia solani]